MVVTWIAAALGVADNGSVEAVATTKHARGLQAEVPACYEEYQQCIDAYKGAKVYRSTQFRDALEKDPSLIPLLGCQNTCASPPPPPSPSPAPPDLVLGAELTWYALDASSTAYVTSAFDNNLITVHGSGTPTSFTLDTGENRYQTVTGIQDGDHITCEKPCAVHGNTHSEWTNLYFKGTLFETVPFRTDPQRYSIKSLHDNTQVTVYDSSYHASLPRGELTKTLSEDELYTFDLHSSNDLIRIEASEPVLVHIESGQIYDSTPLAPASEDYIYGTASNYGYIRTVGDNNSPTRLPNMNEKCTNGAVNTITTYTRSGYCSSYPATANKIWCTNSGSSQRMGESCKYKANVPGEGVTGVQYADSDGGEAAAYLPERMFGHICPVATRSQYIHFISTVQGTVCTRSGTGTSISLTKGSSANGIWSGVHNGNPDALGSVWKCTNPVMATADESFDGDEYNIACFHDASA